MERMMYSAIVALMLILNLATIASSDKYEIDPSRTILWGPGLSPEIVMRSRYFFLQLVDVNGNNVTEGVEKADIRVTIRSTNSNGHTCRVWIQTLNSKDGSYIVRYRLYQTCYDFRIDVTVNNRTIPKGSIYEKGPIYEEECVCPTLSVPDWLEKYQCSSNYSQILNDLKDFPQLNFSNIRTQLIKNYAKPHSVSLCHYVIKNNRIFRRCYGEHVGFKVFSDSILLSLTRKVVLPDTEFFMNLGDWPLVQEGGPLYPIFSWCGSNDTKDIILPTYDITESSLENMGRVMLDMLSVQGNIKTPWNGKIEKMFWRGRDSRRERLKLIDISREHPDLFNVSITNFFFFRDEVAKYGPGQRPISFFNFFDYKYQLNIDGTVAAYRLPYLLAGDSVVFKQESKYYEYFYDRLIPGEHFVPIKTDLSDLVEKIHWAKDNDSRMRQIAKAGRALMREVALPHHVFCYHVSLLQMWSERVKSTISVLEGMEEVGQVENGCPCHAHKFSTEANEGVRSKDEF
ncbi:protein O-glucosyltransferase 2-like [Diachasmimorpha longicaudata]|uniref:protein O-glucosyltransferase 2-like n=1 Tax=Diachasmimorpha longicaudata TaxID=58733 RepID=UPI0030B8DFD4